MSARVVTRVTKRKAAKKTSAHAGKAATHKTTATRAASKTATSRVRTSPAKVSSRSKPAGGAAASGARGLKVRMYRVGFGDFFLVTVPTAAGNQYILIDCGVFKGTTGKGDIGSITDAVDDLLDVAENIGVQAAKVRDARCCAHPAEKAVAFGKEDAGAVACSRGGGGDPGWTSANAT